MHLPVVSKIQQIKCAKLLKYYSLSNIESSCPPDYDGKYCWPATSAISSAEIRCRLNKTAIRWCILSLNNFSKKIYEWEDPDYSKCLLSDSKMNFRSVDIPYMTSLAMLNRYDQGNSYLEKSDRKFFNLSQTGSIVSILTLSIALLIFTKFNQLQDTRVKIHINLFIAIFLQSVVSLFKNVFYGYRISYSLYHNLITLENPSYFCRVLMTCSYYCEITIFTWLMLESWHFFNLISLSPYKIQNLKHYVFVGWGFPIIFIIPWVIVQMSSSEANFCWVKVDMKISIVAIPVYMMILINFCFFLFNVRAIFIKMRNIYLPQRRLYFWRWIKSSLMLAPLFGSYDILHIFWPLIDDEEIKVIALLTVRTIYSYQGFIVSILYCFTNGQVQMVLKRAWKNWKLEREINSKVSKLNEKRLIESFITKENFKYLDIELHF